MIRYEDYQRTNLGCIDRFFDKYLFSAVIKLKIPILILALVWLGVSIWRITELESVSYQEQFFSSDHPVQKILSIQQNVLYNDEKINMNFFFGVRDHLKNYGNVSKWVSSYQGEVQFIDGFNIASEEAQWKIFRFCQKLGNFSRTYSDPMTGRTGQA